MVYNIKKQIQISSNSFSYSIKKYKKKKNKYKCKPEMIAYSNLTKSGVDLVDCACETYSTQRKCKKWWKSIFFYILDITLHNCSIIYNYSDLYHKINKHSSALYYRKILLQQLFNYFCPQDKIE